MGIISRVGNENEKIDEAVRYLKESFIALFRVIDVNTTS